MANNFLKQLQNVVETGKLQGVTNIRDLYNTGFANSGISYKDFKKQMHDYKIYGNLGKNDMARLSRMYYGSKKADWEAKKPQDLARIEKRTFAPAFNLNTPDEISPLNIPVTKPVIKKTVVKSTPKPKNNSNSEQITEVTEIVTNPSFKSPQQDVQSLIEPNSSGNLEYDPITGRVRPGGFAGVGSNEHNALRNSKVGNWIAGIGNWIARNYPTQGGNSMIQFGPTQTADQVKEGWNNLRGLIFTRPGANPSFKTGGNLNKFQQGGKTSSQQDAVMQFVKALAQTLQADPQQVIQAAQQNPEALKSAVQAYQESRGDIQKAAQAFSQVLQSKTQAAKHGAKLNYLKSLKNQCADDEELYYFKKGGSIGCGCKKKEQGGELKEKKESTVSKFKKACGGFKVKFMAGGQSPKKKNLDQASKDSIKINDNQNMELMSERPGKLIPNPKYDKGKTDDRAQLWVPDRTKAPYKKEEKVKKDCGGSKIKLKKGDKVCPKCGKVHAAGIGCSVAKFKYRKLGGQL